MGRIFLCYAVTAPDHPQHTATKDMKNSNQERMRRFRRQYHRSHPWRLGASGHYIPHDYSQGRILSWWDDVGFVLNGRRVMVWWVHPRMKYQDAIEDAAWAEVGRPPKSANHFLDDAQCIKHYKRLGRSRKKIVSYQSPPTAPETSGFYTRLGLAQDKIANEGIELEISPSLTIQALNWCTGVDICIPFEVLNESDAIALAETVRHIMKNGRSLASIRDRIPSGYRYGRENWLSEQELRLKDRKARSE